MKRSAAPKVKVKETIRTRTRDDLIVELDKAHPEYVHAFRDKNVTQRTLQLAEQEVIKENTYTGGESSAPLAYREDIVVRKLRKTYDEERAAVTDESADRVRELYQKPEFAVSDSALDDGEVWKENSPGKRVAKAKDPREIGNEGGM